MKKLYLLGIALLAATFAFAQANQFESVQLNDANTATKYSQAGVSAFNSSIKPHKSMTKDAALNEDFSGTTFPPEGWSQIDGTQSSGNHHWHRGDNFSAGSLGVISGTYALVDYSADGSASAIANQDEWLISPEVTVPANAILNFQILTLYHFMTVNAGASSDYADLAVKVSTDNGSNWTTIWDEDSYYDAVEPESGEWNDVIINLSAYNGMPIKIAFNYTGIDGCWVLLDNVTIATTASVDFELSDAVVQTYPARGVFYGEHGMYRNLPAEEVAGIFCAYEGVVSNYGSTPVDVKLTHKAYGPTGDEIFSYEYAPKTIPAGGFDANDVFVPGRDTIVYYTVDDENHITWIEEALFVFSQYMTDYGEYRFVATLEPTNGTYDNPNNRTLSYTNYTTVTNNCLFSRDNGQLSNSITASSSRFTQIATTYHLYNPEDRVNAIEAYISEAEVGASFHYEILRGTLWDGFEANPIAITDSYVVGENFTPGFITLYTEDIFEPSVTENSPDIIAVAVVMDNEKSFKIGYDETVQHNTYENLGFIDKWYYIGDINGSYMIRLYTCEQEPPQGGAVDSFTANEIEMYPNPTTGIVNFNNVENATIEVFNMMGQIVSRVENANENTTIDLSAVANGNYVVRIVKNGEVATSKLNIAR